MKNPTHIKWLARPDAHDYPAAASYLALIYDRITVTSLVAKLKKGGMSAFKSKDIFRASGLSLLGVSNSHVRKDSSKIAAGKRLSPYSWCATARTERW
jgi:hypothetical protein